MAAVISESAELQTTMPLQPAAQRVSMEAVTCSETWPWSTVVISTPRMSAAFLMMSTESLPRASVEDQIETPILIFSPSELPPSELELPPSPEQPARPARPAPPPVRPAYLRKFLLERLPIVLPSLHLASLACTRCASSLKTMCKQRNRLFTTSKVMSRAARALLFVGSGCQRGFCRLVIPIRRAKMPLGENRLVPAKTFVQGGSCRRSGLCLTYF